MQQVDIVEAAKSLQNLVEAAIAGEEVVIIRNNQPIIKLVPVVLNVNHRQIPAGSAKGCVTISEDFDAPLEEFQDYM